MKGAFATVLAEDELVVAVEVPKLSASARWGYWKFCRKTGEFPEASAAMLLRFTAKMEKEAAEIEHAIEDALAAGARTRDLANPGERVLSTQEMGQAIEESLADVRDRRHSYHGV